MQRWIVLFGFLCCFTLSYSQIQPQKIKPLSYFQPRIDKGEIAGVVTLLASKDKIISLEASGYSNLERKVPMKTDDLFWIASQTKPMAALAFMMLLEEQKISLDDTLYKYIKAFKNQKVEVEIDEHTSVLRNPKKPITFRDLLNHTSGLPPEPPVQKGPYDRVILEDIMPGYAYTHLKNDPGVVQVYSNTGINIIGRMIEVLSGSRFDDFMQQRLFDPLGMKNTTFVPTEAQAARIVTSYMMDSSMLKPVALSFTKPLTDKNRVALPYGGLFSTAADLARFCQMCLNGGELDGRRYIMKSTLDSMLVKRSKVSPFGVGFLLYKEGTYGHSGAFNTDMSIFTKSNLISVTLVQMPALMECRAYVRDAIWALEDQNKPAATKK
jgi:CubicO group peptidase (beta-lactamase class C family)